jgi:hypothetical protein
MATKNTKPPGDAEASKSPPQTKQTKQSQSPAKAMQAHSEAQPGGEERLPVTLRADNSYEYHLDIARSVIEGLLDPDVPDLFLEVPCPVNGARRFLHTSYVKEIDVRGL